MTDLPRRHALALGGAVTVTALIGPLPLLASTTEAQARIATILGGRTAVDGPLRLDTPAIAPDGHFVAVGVEVAAPMAQENHVAALHLIADGNPQPEVASFYFTPQSGLAKVTTRIRLARTQNLTALAEMRDGTVYQSRQRIEVTIGGCGA